jgi:hypothetical protein
MLTDFTNTDNLKDMDDLTEVSLHGWLKMILNQQPVTVTFTKVDGTERVMKCTLQPEQLPPAVIREDAKPRKETTSTKALRVFDLEKKEWRSFTIKNVKRIEL